MRAQEFTNNQSMKVNDLEESSTDYSAELDRKLTAKVTEGWGAEKQKQDAEQSTAAWKAMHAKYANDPEAQVVLTMLHRGGWKAAYAEKELLGAPGAKYNKQFWLDYAKKKGLTEMSDLELDEKANAKLCRSTKSLGNSDQSSCVSQGLRPHKSKGKGHTDGHGNYLKGKKAKGVQYGGDVKDYDGK